MSANESVLLTSVLSLSANNSIELLCFITALYADPATGSPFVMDSPLLLLLPSCRCMLDMGSSDIVGVMSALLLSALILGLSVITFGFLRRGGGGGPLILRTQDGFRFPTFKINEEEWNYRFAASPMR